jgi:hypothetical protein
MPAGIRTTPMGPGFFIFFQTFITGIGDREEGPAILDQKKKTENEIIAIIMSIYESGEFP